MKRLLGLLKLSTDDLSDFRENGWKLTNELIESMSENIYSGSNIHLKSITRRIVTNLVSKHTDEYLKDLKDHVVSCSDNIKKIAL